MLYDRFYHKQQPHKKKQNKTKQKTHTHTFFMFNQIYNGTIKHFKTNEASISNFTKLSIYGEIIRSAWWTNDVIHHSIKKLSHV